MTYWELKGSGFSFLSKSVFKSEVEIFSGILSALKVLNFPNQLILADHCMSWIGCVFTNLERQALEGLGLVENFQLQVTQGFGQQLSYIFSRHFPIQLYFWVACQPSCSTACWLISSTTFPVKKKGGLWKGSI